MSRQPELDVEFSPPTRQILPMITVLVVVFTAVVVLLPQIQPIFNANPVLNAVIVVVFAAGTLATFLQVFRLRAAVGWIRDLDRNFEEGNKPPALLAAMAPLMREGRMSRRLAASSTRVVLDSVAQRLDETRDITRYIIYVLILIGLLGTFFGLSLTVTALEGTLAEFFESDSAAAAEGAGEADRFQTFLAGIVALFGGMGTAFASSLLGLAGSLVVGLLDIFAGHAQNRFYRELEEWISSFTRLGVMNEGEGPEGVLVALLERVDEGLEKTTEFATKAEVARIEAENRLARAADVVAEMANQIEHERSAVGQMVSEMREARENQSSREYATLNVLKRIDAAQASVASGQQAVVQLLDRSLENRRSGGLDAESKQALRSMEAQLRQLTDDLSVGRHESTNALRQDLRALIQLIDVRTSSGGGG
ncbi:MAG: biopolymer transporter ExbB [Pseudomonadota bacterium]